MLDLEYREGDTTLLCTFCGEFRSHNSSAVERELESRFASLGGRSLPEGLKVSFDLEKATFVSSAFLRIVLMTAKRVKPGHFKVDRASPFVKDLFRSSGLDSLLVDSSHAIESVLHETRVLPPPADFAARARIGEIETYRRLHAESLRDPAGFWGRQAEEHLVWQERWTEVLRWESPDARWFVGGRLNASANVLDRHLDGPLANKAAILWEGEPAGSGRPGEERVLSYRQLHREVCRFANVLKRHGVKKGDRVLLYLPMVPETVLRCVPRGRRRCIEGDIESWGEAALVDGTDERVLLRPEAVGRRAARGARGWSA